MPIPQAPSIELAEILKKANAALQANDLEPAKQHMAAAAELCGRLQVAGLGIPEDELKPLRKLAEECGSLLASANRRLNSASMRDENHRRGIRSYHATLLQGLR